MQEGFLQAVLSYEPCTPFMKHEHSCCSSRELSAAVATQEPHNTETGKNFSMGRGRAIDASSQPESVVYSWLGGVGWGWEASFYFGLGDCK